MSVFVCYRLQMLSSGLTQRGEDDEGINGFLPADINIELARAAKMVIESLMNLPVNTEMSDALRLCVLCVCVCVRRYDFCGVLSF